MEEQRKYGLRVTRGHLGEEGVRGEVGGWQMQRWSD